MTAADEPDDDELARRQAEQRRALAEREQAWTPTAARPVFTLPPSPDELQAARERSDERQRQISHDVTIAWRQVPRGMQATDSVLLERCAPRLRKAIELRPNLSALILGPTGVGKTSAAAYLVRRALSEYKHSNGERFGAIVNLAWIYAPDLIKAEHQHPIGEGKPTIVNQAFSAHALVLDDVGAACCIQLMIDILTKRYLDGDRPMIVTSGLTQRELTTHLHAAGLRKITHQPSPSPVLCIDLHDGTADKASAKR